MFFIHIYIFSCLRGGCENPLILQLPKPSLVNKFPCLLKMPSANLQKSVFFFSFSLPPTYEDWFQITSGKLPARYTNQCASYMKKYINDPFLISFPTSFKIKHIFVMRQRLYLIKINTQKIER